MEGRLGCLRRPVRNSRTPVYVSVGIMWECYRDLSQFTAHWLDDYGRHQHGHRVAKAGRSVNQLLDFGKGNSGISCCIRDTDESAPWYVGTNFPKMSGEFADMRTIHFLLRMEARESKEIFQRERR